ncbi:MAG: HEPN domain-containing protein [Candidatus Pacearchaeota archaeon]|nr:HEPN domain-containing protein [Candidatus Pacearchaeota archaeon]
MEKEYKLWMKKAEEDLDTAKYNFEGKKFSASLFFSQQAAEKALKAFNIKINKELIKTHDLSLLARKVNAPVEIENLCKSLSPAYQSTRYPDIIQKNDMKDEAKELLKSAEEIVEWAKKKL